jgi:hypothetical protein
LKGIILSSKKNVPLRYILNKIIDGTLNKVMLIGHLGDEIKCIILMVEIVLEGFQLATNEVYINKTTNEKISSTEWHNLVVRNKAAEICEKHLSKGIRYISKAELSPASGRLRTELQNILAKFRLPSLRFYRQRRC